MKPILSEIRSLYKEIKRTLKPVLKLTQNEAVMVFVFSAIAAVIVARADVPAAYQDAVMAVVVGGGLVVTVGAAGRQLLAEKADIIGTGLQKLIDFGEALANIDIPDDIEKRLVDAAIDYLKSLQGDGAVG